MGRQVHNQRGKITAEAFTNCHETSVSKTPIGPIAIGSINISTGQITDHISKIYFPISQILVSLCEM